MTQPLEKPKPGQTSAENHTPHREKAVRQILIDTGAFLVDSHFVLSSGKHADSYVNKDAVYPHTEQTRELCRMWAQDFAESGVEVVVGPQLGAIVLANNTASELTQITGKDVLAIPAEKDGEDFKLGRGYDQLVKGGKRVLVVEDVVTTGKSVKKVVDLVRRYGGEVIGVGILCNRGAVMPQDIGVEETDTLLNLDLPSWIPEECIPCRGGVSIDTRVGHGKKYLEGKATK